MIVTNHKPRIIIAGAVRLMPGDNEVDETEFKTALQSEIVQRWVSDGNIEPSGATSKPKTKPKPKPTNDVKATASEVIEQIKGLDDADAIQALAEGEDRVTVLDAVDKRLGELGD